ncbi:nucleotide exchange factor GrpE [Oxyplasma meridianum]|uniref:Protein GrpE n=1 Tax=Oxyplasma meridianum TaxID=3073602 RepID=A0AAX4NG61_9ARCH
MSSERKIKVNHDNTITYEMEKSRIRTMMQYYRESRRLEKENTDLMDQIKTIKDSYIRQRAEMENYLKAKERELNYAIKSSNKEMIKSLLPFIDSLDSANMSEEQRSFLAPLRDQLRKILSSYGLNQINAKGQKFDPYLHEALAVTDQGENGIVYEEIQKGYKLNDEVLRTSKVIVGKR